MMTPVLNVGYNCSPPLDNALNNQGCNYAAIQSPCLANGAVYTAQNISSALNSTTLQFYKEAQNGTFYSKNFSAPEQCIYRQSASWGSIITLFLEQTIFQGGCVFVRDEVMCSQNSAIALGQWLSVLYNNESATLESIESYFESFAMAMTNQYRITFGSSIFRGSEGSTDLDTLPQGEAQGIVWESTVCNSIQWEWLLLPVLIWLITSILLVWTVVRSWRLRHVEPVWKENVLPAMLYRERFRRDDGSSLGPNFLDKTAVQVVTETEEQGNKLLETEEIREMASKVLVRFQ
jgi:hypothetical protein